MEKLTDRYEPSGTIIHSSAMMKNHHPKIITSKTKTYSKKKNKNNKKAYTNKSKCIRKKVGFAAVFLYINRRSAFINN